MSEKHYEWLLKELLRKDSSATMSLLGKKVAQILGTVWEGIYHLNPSSYLHKRTDWSRPDLIRIVIFDEGLATYDFDRLTKLVILAHDYCVRLDIGCAGMRHLSLNFSARKMREFGNVFERHPTIETAISDSQNLWRPKPEEVLV